MITLNTFGYGKRYERRGYQVVCSFLVFLRQSSEKNPTETLPSSGTFIDFFKKKDNNCITSPYDDFQYFRSTLIKKFSKIFNENDRISYIDNDNDEIPIDQQSEFLEALKFAAEQYKDNNKKVTLIITKAKVKSVKSSQKAKKTESSNNSSDKMPPMRVESTPLRDLLNSETPEGAAAVNEFQDFLQSYKKQIVAEVTDEVIKKMAMAMMFSKNIGIAENPSSRLSQSFSQKIPEELQKLNKSTDAEPQDCGKGPDDPRQSKAIIHIPRSRRPQYHETIKLHVPEQLLSGSNPPESQNSVERTANEHLIKEKLQKKGNSYEKNIADTSENSVIGPQVEKVYGHVSSHVPYFSKDLKESTEEKNIADTSENTVIGPQLEKCSRCVANEKISDDIFYLAENLREDVKEKLLAGTSNICLHHRLELDKARRTIKKHLADENNPPSEAEKSGPSEKSGNNDDNQDVNEKQSPSNSDNISFVSDDDSYLSDEATGYIYTEDKDKIEFNNILFRLAHASDESSEEEVEEPRHDSSSSFELVCESPSLMEEKKQPFFLGTEPQKPLKDSFLIESKTFIATPKDNVISSTFDAETREKSHEKNIAETSEDTVIAPQLEKRSGGAYCYVPHIFEELRENVFDVSSSKSAKSSVKKFKKSSFHEEPRGVGSFGKKKTAEQQKSSEERETRQPRRRVVFDHNTAKGLGDTKQTSPTIRKANAFGQPLRANFTGHDPIYDHHYRPAARPPPYFGPPLPFPDERIGNHENWSYFYGGQVPPQMNQPQWPPGYPPYPDTMHILPETLISGAVQAASSAYTTARKVIEKIRSPPPDSPGGPQPPKM